jgi:alpha-beta hydrolase superfamily lysophospholipase
MSGAFSLADYMRRENEVFRDVKDLEAHLPESDRSQWNRYSPESPVNPATFSADWNRSFELAPDQPPRGGALLLHGLTDAPYSVRPVARILRDGGYYALCLRMPAHGTVPAALTHVVWEDWLAAVRVGARHVREKIGAGKPLLLVGYSNGGALAVKYSLDALEQGDLPKADRVLLLSPMIGVSPFAPLARVVSLLGSFSYFEKSKWLDIQPEYNPFKYNSFPANAGVQTHKLTAALQEQIRKATQKGTIRQLPPMLCFASLVDSTVSTPATVERLYGSLSPNGSELVLFDMNRRSALRPFLRREDEFLLAKIWGGKHGNNYRLTVVTNASANSPEVEEESQSAVNSVMTTKALGLSWPPQIYSLSHVAIPFPADDPLYGINPDTSESYGLSLGTLSPRGEKSVLTVPMDQWMRISSNPFFPYMRERIKQWAAEAISH